MTLRAVKGGRSVKPHPNDVLAMLDRRPTTLPVDTGIPFPAPVAQWVAPGALVALMGEPGRGKTALALAAAATLLNIGADVIVHAVDRDPVASAHRLATLLDTDVTELRACFPRLRVWTGDVAESVAMVTTATAAIRLLVLDSIQKAAPRVSCRPDAKPHEQIDAVMSQLDEARCSGALVIATSEQAPSGDDRYSHGICYEADIRARCERDDAGRFALAMLKYPGHTGETLRAWYRLGKRGWPIEATAPATTSASTRKRATRNRRADNPPARTDDEIAADIRAFLSANPGAKAREVCAAVEGRDSRVTEQLRAVGTRVKGGWRA